MINVAFIVYRKWTFKILDSTLNYLKKKNKFILITSSNCEVKLDKYKNLRVYKINPKNNLKLKKILSKNKIKIAFFYGWSWIITKNIYKNFLSLCLHPSDLPKYRGGSPLQHQIINGVKKSAVTVFQISKGIDSGPIYKKLKLSLRGDLKTIFNRISSIGTKITISLLKDYNNNSKITLYKKKSIKKIYKRRKSKHSEFKLYQVKKKSFYYFSNFIRALNHPSYPNAFFIYKKKKIFVRRIIKIKLSRNIRTVSDTKKIHRKIYSNFIKLKDSYAQIKDGYIVKTI
jgi:methionyl-tRNA formyltransferase